MTVSSLLGKRLELLRSWVSHLSQHLWWSDSAAVQRGAVGSEMSADIHSTAPAPGLTALQELVGRNSVQTAPSSRGTLLCCDVRAALSPLLSSISTCSSHRGKQWNEGRVGVIWGWWDCSEDKDTSTRTGNPSHFQTTGNLSLFTNYYYKLQKRKWN